MLEKVPLLILSAASCVVTYLAQRSEAVVGVQNYPLSLRLANAVVSYASYLWKTIWPVDLSIVYPLRLDARMSWVLVTAAVLATFSFAAWYWRRQKPHLLVGWLWYIGTLVPVIGLVQVGGQSMADRYTYFPLVGIFTAISFEAVGWLRSMRVRPATAGVVAGFILATTAGLTIWQLQFWRNTETLFARALEVTSSNAVAHVNYGMALEQSGRREDAMQHYERALEINPSLAQAHNNLANLEDAAGQSEKALEHYLEAVRLKPNSALAHANLGSLLARLGRYDEAGAQFAEAMRLAPRDPRPHYLLGKALLRQGRIAEALSSFRAALARDPNDVASLVYSARVLATNPDPALRNGTMARQLAEHANQLTSQSHPVVLDTLAAALAEQGSFEQAAELVRQAIKVGSEAGNTQMVARLQAQLSLYLSHQPTREVLTNLESVLLRGP